MCFSTLAVIAYDERTLSGLLRTHFWRVPIVMINLLNFAKHRQHFKDYHGTDFGEKLATHC